jgi:hypothetical protein
MTPGTTTPIGDLLRWAQLDFLVTLGALVTAVANAIGIWRNLVLMGRLVRRLEKQHDDTPPE